jgi:dihydroflavonol-4-reductase
MGDRYHLGYWDTKYEAQQLILKAVQEDNLPAVVVNPTFMFGNFASLLGSGKMIQAVYQGKLPGYTQGGRNYIAVQDVCVGIANAIEKGRVGECYILGNQNLSYQEIFTLIAKTIGANPPKRFLPRPIVLAYGGVLTFLGRIFGFEPTVNYRMAQISFDEHYYSAQKAIKELDLTQTPIEEAIQEAFGWLKANKSI